MPELEFLSEILSDNELSDLSEILDFSLDPNIDLEQLQKTVALSNFHQVKLTKILLKLKMLHVDEETEFEAWHSEQFHEVAMDYDGQAELLKTAKDYEREIKKLPEYKSYKSGIRKLEKIIEIMHAKEKEFNSFDWKVKSIIDLHKLQHNIMY